MPATFDPTEAMEEVAKRCGVYVQYGTLEPLDNEKKTAHNLLNLARPTGGASGRYRRTHPPGPWIYTGGGIWEFQYVAGNEYPVFETQYGQVGMAMCSEVYMPEVTRALSLRGAEIIFLPAGVDKKRLWGTWRNLIWSRAIENLAIVITTQNLFDKSQRGLAMVATPEEVIFESTKAGMFMVDVDLERMRELREQNDEVTSSGAKRGQGRRAEAMATARVVRQVLPKRRRGQLITHAPPGAQSRGVFFTKHFRLEDTDVDHLFLASLRPYTGGLPV